MNKSHSVEYLFPLVSFSCCSFYQVDHTDKSGQSGLVHAALRGHLDIIQYLLQLEWSSEGQQQDCALKNKALQQAFIAASSMGHTQVQITHFTSSPASSDVRLPLICVSLWAGCEGPADIE